MNEEHKLDRPALTPDPKAQNDSGEAMSDVAGAKGQSTIAVEEITDTAGSSESAESIDESAPTDPVLDMEARQREAGVDSKNPFGRLGRPLSSHSPFRIGFGGALGVGLAYLLYQALVNAQHQLILVLVAAFLAIGLNPAVQRLERFGLRRSHAVGLVFLALVGFFALFAYAVLPPVVEQAGKFISALPDYLNDLRGNRTIHGLDERFHIIDKAQEYVTSSDLGAKAANGILAVGVTLASTFFNGLTILILTLYLLAYFNRIKEISYRLVPRARRSRVMLLGDEILARVGGYVAGAFSIALIAGTVSLIWLFALGVPYPLPLALIVMIADLIPLVGATIGAVVVTTVALFVSLPVGIATGIFYIIYQQVENYVVYPRVMKKSVDVNPAAAIVAALLGGALLGIVGALLAIPTAAAIQLILREVVLPRQDAK